MRCADLAVREMAGQEAQQFQLPVRERLDEDRPRTFERSHRRGVAVEAQQEAALRRGVVEHGPEGTLGVEEHLAVAAMDRDPHGRR